MTGKQARAAPPTEALLRVPEHVMMREVGGDLVMLDLRGERYFGLNDVGAHLMLLARDGATERQLVDGLAAEFEVARPQLEADVRRLATELLQAGLLERVAPR